MPSVIPAVCDPWLGIASVFMAHGKVFPRQPNGMPMFHNNHAFHIENKKLVAWLENRCIEAGVVITDATEIIPCSFWNRLDNDINHIPWVHRATALRKASSACCS